MTSIPAPGSRWRHTNGNEYEVMCIANLHSTNPQYRITVVYVGTNGRIWARPVTDWHRSMTPLAAKGE